MTSNGQSAVTVRQCRPTWCQMPGTETPRCGSLASSGFPVVVRLGPTTQELEPIPSPVPSSAVTLSTDCAAPSSAAACPVLGVGTAGAAARDRRRRPRRQRRRRRGGGAPGLPVGLGQDRLVQGGRVCRVQPGQRGGVHDPGQAGPGELGVEVAAQVPRHRLEPGQRVQRGPLLDPVVRQLGGQDGVLEGEVGRVSRGGQVVVDPVGVRRQVPPGGRSQPRQLLLGDLSPPHRPDHLVGVQARLADELGEAPGRDVPAQVHLEEAVLRRDEPLGPEQVDGVAGVDVRHAACVADDRDIGPQPFQRDGPARLRPGPADQPGSHDRAGDEGHDDEDEHS